VIEKSAIDRKIGPGEGAVSIYKETLMWRISGEVHGLG